jgi:ketosteroid isomerase-like protein
MIDRAAVDGWLEDYVEAWERYDRAAIGALFSVDCVYRYRPAGDEIEGRDAIVRSWLEDDPDDPGTYDAEYRTYAIDGDRAVAVGASTYIDAGGSVRAIYDNCFLLRFDGDGRCSEFTEWFMKRGG